MTRVIILAAATCAGLACSVAQTVDLAQDEGGKYSTSFPGPGRTASLDPALQSVRMISSIGFYRQADFTSASGWPADRPITDRIWKNADTVTTFTESVVGTGTVLQFSRSRLALLTSAHVVTFDDTVTTYYRDERGETGVRSFAVKVKQRNYVADIPGTGDLEVLARNDGLDIAIVGQSINTRDLIVPVFPLPPGKARDLDWGSFVYVIGFPAGLRMVTSGIVSQPSRDRDASFVTDVLFNRGMSGGAILAARSGGATLEWVGIATSGSATTEHMLAPNEKHLHEGLTSGEPYEGEVFISRAQRIRYGVTMAVSIEAVRKLAADNRAHLLRRGYSLSVLE
ncbi:MAG TPA: serine protease [Rhodothermales bacterium]|nr:serine protease [Rhodothermales bacterium]